MPNWCNNTMTISHDDPAMMERAVKAWNNGKFLSEFIPVPYELTLVGGARVDITKISNMDHHREMEELVRKLNVKYFGCADWYDFCCNNWGTKWDIGADSGETVDLDGNTFSVRFCSAWSPPTTAYEKLAEMGFYIKAYYYEPGMAFCGRWEDGVDEHIDIPATADKARLEIPEDIDQEMGIVDSMEEWETENA